MEKFDKLPYTRPNFEEIKKELLSLIDAFKNALLVEEQINIIKRINKIDSEFETQANLASIRNSIDTRDKFYEAEQAFFDDKWPEYADIKFEYYQTLASSKFKEALKKEYGEQIFTIAEYRVKAFSKENIADQKELNKLSSEYSKLVASAKIEFEGQELNLSQLTPYGQSDDRSLRKKSSNARYDFVAANEAQFDDIYDKMVKIRHRMAQRMGFKNYIELGYLEMQRSDYNQEMVEAYRKQVLDYIVPITVALRKKQAKRLGLDSLKNYDQNYHFKTGNAKPQGDADWILANGKKMYDELSPETKEFFTYMTDYELMDLVTKPGKDIGGYCTFIPNYSAPFIFSNFNGTSGDIDVLTHEAGHAFQVFSSKNQPLVEYFWPTFESAEIHSMSMEFFTWPWMELFFKESTEKYKFNHLEGSLVFLPYGVAVDEFQHVVYENPNMTPAERKAAWRKVEKKYQPDLDWDGHPYLELGGRWQLQSHIYQRPFYYIDYTLAQICAFQFWVRMQEDYNNAWQDYLKLCKAGGSLSFLKLVELAGLESPFKEGVLKNVASKIENWLGKIDDTKL